MSTTLSTSIPRRVLLLETDERSGLVAALAAACAAQDISLEITTGASHVLLTFAADDTQMAPLLDSLRTVPGVEQAHVYTLAQ